jgi:hypothetical protein
MPDWKLDKIGAWFGGLRQVLPLLLSLTNTVMFWKSSWITLNHPRLHHHASFTDIVPF